MQFSKANISFNATPKELRSLQQKIGDSCEHMEANPYRQTTELTDNILSGKMLLFPGSVLNLQYKVGTKKLQTNKEDDLRTNSSQWILTTIRSLQTTYSRHKQKRRTDFKQNELI